jgi:hypothetical protein
MVTGGSGRTFARQLIGTSVEAALVNDVYLIEVMQERLCCAVVRDGLVDPNAERVGDAL